MAKLELHGRITGGTNTGFSAVIAVFTGIVILSMRANPEMLTVAFDFPGYRGLVLAQNKSDLDEVFPGIEHLLNILAVL